MKPAGELRRQWPDVLESYTQAGRGSGQGQRDVCVRVRGVGARGRGRERPGAPPLGAHSQVAGALSSRDGPALGSSSLTSWAVVRKPHSAP